MSGDRRKRIEQLFAAALDRSPEQRAAYLRQVVEDEAVRAEVLSLLQAHDARGRLDSIAELLGSVSPDLQPRLQTALGDAYRIERELGGGGMSRVFLAEESALGRQVVVKVLPPDLAALVRVDRFRREIHLTASLQHPHIVPLLTAGSADGLLYYTMPLVEGESLRARLAREGELPIDEAIRLLRDVADALAYAHQHGVLHRDIKPDNILVSSHHALVADFGVARALSAATAEGFRTLEGVTPGTPTYMAPEQAIAHPHTDHRADLYALGVVGYEMLTGTAPFPWPTGQPGFAAKAPRPTTPVTQARPGIPDPLAALIMRCLEQDPGDRWQTAAEVLQRLDAMTTPSGGTVATAALGTSRPAARRRWLVLATTAIAAALALSPLLLKRSKTGGSLDPNLLAVAPFDALGGELEIWREGLVDLLSRNLDGAGSLRTVSPSVVVGPWKGRADPASASALGRRTGAGLVVSGTLVAIGQDSVRLSGTILDVARDRTLGEVQLRGHTRHMDELADSLTVSLLRELGRTRDIVAVRTASLRATSLPALKAFLQGERMYRRGAWDSAQGAYRRALAHDSTFVPALRHLGHSLSWRAGGDVAEQNRSFLRAGELNHGLPRRDSLLVTADSLGAALIVDTLPLPLRRPLRQRLFATLEEGVRLYPDDPEMWYALGDARFHWGWELGVREPQMLDAFDRSIALDSGFTPAYHHATTLGLTLYGLDGWDRYALPYLALRPSEGYAAHTRLVDAILKSRPAQPGHTDSIIRSASLEELFQGTMALLRFPDSAEAAVRLGRALLGSRGHSTGIVQDPLIRRQTLAAALAQRGHLREAQTLIEGEERIAWFAGVAAGTALLGSSRPESVDATFGRWLQRGSFWAPGEWPTGGPPGPLLYALPWWAVRRDTLALAEYARRADSTQRIVSQPDWKERAQYAAEAARAYSVLARGDTAAALRFFETVSPERSWPLERMTAAQILASRGRVADALELLDGAFWPGWTGPMRVLGKLEAARAAERLGQQKRAAAGYQYVVDVWRHADPELEPYVRQARAGLERMVVEPAH